MFFMISLKSKILDFIQAPSFPCLMAKAVARHGYLKTHELIDHQDESSLTKFLGEFHSFVDELRTNENRLSSFIVTLDDPALVDFTNFEKAFWPFLERINRMDKAHYPHDPRVKSDPEHEEFSFSIKSEAFFIVALHPQSPRWSRRFSQPAIVFNQHSQFEKLRQRGVFGKVRDLIRARDKELQGSINPMLSDFGGKSEVFQYLGKIYGDQEPVPLNI